MKLTDNEIRDINRYLEEGKPLPDKYRFMLFDEKSEVELVWNGKTGDVTNVALPFQTIEQIDEPRAEKEQRLQLDIFSTDERGRQQGGWTNKLIWGDNKLVLSSLKNGSLRDEIERQGGIKLIYIDPPFDVGADFSMQLEVGDEQFTKEPTVLEELAYRDTWGKGSDSFIAMIYERLLLMKDLLAADGSIYVHCDHRVSAYIKLVMDEIFGKDNFDTEIIWKATSAHANNKTYGSIHNTIYFYKRSTDRYTYNTQYVPYDEEYAETYYRYKDPDGRRFMSSDLVGHKGVNKEYEWRGIVRPWRYPIHRLDELDSKNKIFWTKNNFPRYKRYLDEMSGMPAQSIWNDNYVRNIRSWDKENTGYSTQKSEGLIQRIMEASSNEGDIVADFFAGSGTTLAVAEKLNRKWIGSDLGKFSIHTSRKRLISVQRGLKNDSKPYRAFEILNLGKYERQHYVGVNENLRDEEKQQQLVQREKNFVDLIVRAYQSEPVEGFKTFVAKKNARLVAVGPINMPVSRLYVEEVITECVEKHISKADILAFEFEMGLFPNIQEEAKSKGVDLALKYIPPDVFDKRAIEKNQVVFYDVAYIEIKPHIEKQSVAVELTDFSVFYNQDTIAHAEASLKDGGSKIVVENGQIIKVSKDKNGLIERETLTKKWTDWIDYWSVDFNFESKKEIVSIKKDDGSIEEAWTGDYIFENEWQSFRTKKDRNLELKSVTNECSKGRRKIAVKVVDIFGNDTMKVIEVTI